MAPGKRKATSSPGSHPREAPRSPRFMPCPTCGKSFLARSLQQHAWTCAEAGPEAPPSDDNDTDVSGKGSSVNCPVCSRPFPQHAIESHAWGCMPPTDDLEVAAAPKRSPIGAGRGKRAIPANKEQSPARITDTRRASPSLPSRGSEIDLVSTASAASSTPEVPSSNMTVSRSGDVMQRLMAAGKRASKAERELKIVPPAWPIERIEDIFPAKKADSLLASMLHASRDWTSRPWFNAASGIPGMTHSRSCMYRISTAQDTTNNSTTTTTTNTAGTDRNQTGSAQTPGQARQRGGSRPTADPDGVTESDSGECAGAMRGKAESGAGDVLQSSVDESFHAGEGGGADPSGSAAALERSEGVVPGSAPDSETEGSEQRKSWLSDEGPKLAPRELLEVVPLVVEVVRRGQRRRAKEGLGGHEGSDWNPNFCICHIYDNHRNYLGAHSDTLSIIGPDAIVVGLSLGAKRVFMVQKKLPWGSKAAAGSGSEGTKKLLDMPHNSAIVMWAGCQERYKHAVPNMTKGVGTHPIAGTNRISITLRERKEALPRFLLPVPNCCCGVPAELISRVLPNGKVHYLFRCDRAQGREQCGFTLSKGPRR